MKTTIYTADDVKRVVSYLGIDGFLDTAIDRLEQGFLNYNRAAYKVPVREGFEYYSPTVGLVEWMPSMQVDGNIVLKLVGYHPDNPEQYAVPSVLSSSLVFDTKNGHLQSVMDSTFLTAIRTAAASAVASKILANPESSTLGLIGCGAQAVTQLHAISRLFPIRKAYFFDTDASVVASFPNRIAGLNIADIELLFVNTEELVKHSDIICTTTSVDIGKGPVFADLNLKEHTHINAVGADFPGKIEVPLSVLERSLVCPDFKEQALKEGECQQLGLNHIGPDLITLIQDRVNYLAYQFKPTVFDSTGWAFEDFIMTDLMCDFAKKLDLGTSIDLLSIGKDCKNPYSFILDE